MEHAAPITFGGMPSSPAVEASVRDEAATVDPGPQGRQGERAEARS